MAVTQLTQDDFQKEVLDAEQTVVVDFNADWCGPCKMLAPIFESVSEKLTDVKFCSINTDDNQDTAMQYNITGIPCLIIFKGGQEVKRLVGLQTEESLVEEINKV